MRVAESAENSRNACRKRVPGWERHSQWVATTRGSDSDSLSQQAEIGAPGSDVGADVSHEHARDLRDVRQIVRHPAGQQLVQRHRAELGMDPGAPEVGRTQAEPGEPIEIVRPQTFEL